MNLGHGGNVEEIARMYNLSKESIIDFSANINPVGISNIVKSAMISSMDRIEKYPDITYHNLKNAISNYENTDYNRIVLGNGAAEVIFNIVRGLKPNKVLLPAPTFSEYEDAVLSIDGSIKYYKMREEFILDEGFINSINDDIDMVFICNPNNPTGVLTNKIYITRVLERALESNTTVVVDESFIDFLQDKNKYSVIDLCREYRNLIVVKSLTKFYAFPGIRIGYSVMGDTKLVESINKISVPWSINSVASTAGEIAIAQKEYILRTIEYVNREKNYLYNELSKLKSLKVYYPSVNFILFKINKGIDIKSELLKSGILIRSCSNYIGLDTTYYRVAVRTHEENIKLIEALGMVLNI